MSDSALLKNDQLALCDKLKQAGFPQEYKVGAQLCRGFADLGYEQFLLLPADKLLSLFTGDCSSFDEAHKEHFAVIPTVSMLVAYLEARGSAVSLEYEDGEWRLALSFEQYRLDSTTKSLWNELLECCIALSNEIT